MNGSCPKNIIRLEKKPSPTWVSIASGPCKSLKTGRSMSHRTKSYWKMNPAKKSFRKNERIVKETEARLAEAAKIKKRGRPRLRDLKKGDTIYCLSCVRFLTFGEKALHETAKHRVAVYKRDRYVRVTKI